MIEIERERELQDLKLKTYFINRINKKLNLLLNH
jgi:hypothetical protein